VTLHKLAHAGRKGSTPSPFIPTTIQYVSPDKGGWEPVGASALPWGEGWLKPHELTKDEIQKIVQDFKSATRRALEAGFGNTTNYKSF
jgi:2,4-dienoyl-CoA reductase-like NADH-dependent reductase (Old Yellow Enzyme family)